MCPTELEDLAKNYAKFKEIGCEIYSVSCDTHFVHKAWHDANEKIAKIEVLSHNETAGLSDPAFAQIPEAIIAAQSTSVDAVTGATKTSEALIAAVNDALSQVK